MDLHQEQDHKVLHEKKHNKKIKEDENQIENKQTNRAGKKRSPTTPKALSPHSCLGWKRFREGTCINNELEGNTA